MKLERRKCSKVVACLGLGLLLVGSQTWANSTRAQVLEVLNGYSFRVLVGNEVKIVRLAEIISPKAALGTFPCEKQAKAFLQKKTAGKTITLVFWALDAVGRSVCEAFLPDGSSLSRLMVENGYALQDRYYNHSTELSTLENAARVHKVGVWQYLASSL